MLKRKKKNKIIFECNGKRFSENKLISLIYESVLLENPAILAAVGEAGAAGAEGLASVGAAGAEGLAGAGEAGAEGLSTAGKAGGGITNTAGNAQSVTQNGNGQAQNNNNQNQNNQNPLSTGIQAGSNVVNTMASPINKTANFVNNNVVKPMQSNAQQQANVNTQSQQPDNPSNVQS